MADINYPSNLPDFKLGKTRSEVQKFGTSQPFAGSLYVEQITDDSPVTWGVEIICKNRLEARSVRAFIRMVSNGQPFNKDIWTEEGFISHEVRFIEMPLTPQQITNNVWSYSGLIYATKLLSNDEDIDNDELLADWLTSANIIDIAMNQSWPSE